jgi:myo-inositol-1(or 4)-monophosphatase
LPDADRKQELEVLTAAVREAGALALQTFRGQIKSWTKGGASPVSEADLAVDALLRERLLALGPGYGWLSEETEDDPARLAADAVWIVDPIDGTRAYLAGTPDWVVSAALAVAGRPVLAAVFAPVTDELFLAAAGTGTTRNGVPMAASTGDQLDAVKVAGPKRTIQSLADIHPALVAPPRLGSLALRLARVAQGELDIVFASGRSHDWDLAAADLLVHEAGGALTTVTGQPVIYNRPELVHGALVAAGRGRHALLIALVRDRQLDFA